MLELERIREKISKLDESDAKSLLMIFYLHLRMSINQNENGEHKIMEETIKYLLNIYNEIPDIDNIICEIKDES